MIMDQIITVTLDENEIRQAIIDKIKQDAPNVILADDVAIEWESDNSGEPYECSVVGTPKLDN